MQTQYADNEAKNFSFPVVPIPGIDIDIIL